MMGTLQDSLGDQEWNIGGYYDSLSLSIICDRIIHFLFRYLRDVFFVFSFDSSLLSGRRWVFYMDLGEEELLLDFLIVPNHFWISNLFLREKEFLFDLIF